MNILEPKSRRAQLKEAYRVTKLALRANNATELATKVAEYENAGKAWAALKQENA
jgi:hypothetical protein